MAEKIEESGLAFREAIPEEPVFILADGHRMYRVFQNLIDNTLKYSLDGSRVYVELSVDGTCASASVKNISRYELDDVDVTERFVRGDHSRSTSGSGLGLSIAKSFTEACGGCFRIIRDADLFTAVVEFQILQK